MKRWISVAITFFFFFCLNSQAHANSRGVQTIIIGGGAGAIVGQAIGRNTESTVLGATVGGIIGAVIASENSHNHRRTVVIHTLPKKPRGHHFNYGPRHHSPRVVFIQPYKHGKKQFKKEHGHKRVDYKRGRFHSEKRNSHQPRDHRSHHGGDRFR